ncbi:MAG: AIR carboxylase family protein [DPANN group archaeon]|nr:AIR carboxylase family protein [DPANN group archaeon]
MNRGISVKGQKRPALVIFGSQSDASIYERVIARLHAEAVSSVFRICSAHRSPGYLSEILKNEEYGLVIAGAGLAAHLPGVVASQTIRPVIGVPVSSSLGGLDALLSIIQMPPGIPVLSVGIDAAEEAARHAALMSRSYDEICIVTNGLLMERFEKARVWLQERNIPHVFSDEPLKEKVNVLAFSLSRPASFPGELFIIRVPVLSEGTPEDALLLARTTSEGLFVGLNRVENAVIAAAQILSMDGSFDDQHHQYRKDMEKAIRLL